MEIYSANGLIGIIGCEPSCPICRHVNAMLIDWEEADKIELKYNQGIVYKCRDCGHIYIWKEIFNK